MKLLKGRPEIHRLYQKLKSGKERVFDFGVFESFLVNRQRVGDFLSDVDAKLSYPVSTFADGTQSAVRQIHMFP